MGETDREKTYGKQSGSGYLWCLHCQRIYKNGEFRKEIQEIPDGSGQLRTFAFQMCPYKGCDGSTVLDGWEWEDVRYYHTEYPEIPERNKVYPIG